MRLKDFLSFYRQVVIGKVTFSEFKAAYQTFDSEILYLDLTATNADKLKTMTNQHGTIENMADAITGKALHFWALSLHLMYKPDIETMKEKVDEIQAGLTQEQFSSYVESKRKSIERSN